MSPRKWPDLETGASGIYTWFEEDTPGTSRRKGTRNLTPKREGTLETEQRSDEASQAANNDQHAPG